MEPIIWMLIGAVGVMLLILLRLAAKHGWTWVAAKLQARAANARSDLRREISGVIGPLDERIEQRIHAALQSEIARIDSDLAALKTKVGA
jgi:uncharacterized small protein (DUF1192 family)